MSKKKGYANKGKDDHEIDAEKTEAFDPRTFVARKPYVKVEPFGFLFAVYAGPEKFIKATLKNFGVDMTENVMGASGYAGYLSDSSGASYFHMMLPEEYNEETLWHECLHMAFMMLDHASVEVSPDNHEILCYLQGHIAYQAKKMIYPGIAKNPVPR